MTFRARMISSLAMTAMLLGAAPPGTGRIVWVIDGDTVRLATGERIRIALIDAAETRHDQARCPGEIVTGKAATQKAIALLKGREVGIVRVGRSYNRSVARLSLAGRDVGQLLIEKGAARPWPRGLPKPDWCRAR